MQTEARRAYDRARMRAKMDFVRNYKAERGCSWCPEGDPDCLELHHRDSEEKHPKIKSRKGWRQSIYNLGWKALEAEVLKCDVLCANCHAKQSAAERRARHPDRWE